MKFILEYKGKNTEVRKNSKSVFITKFSLSNMYRDENNNYVLESVEYDQEKYELCKEEAKKLLETLENTFGDKIKDSELEFDDELIELSLN
jgi:3-dehydroquinate synthetase